MAQELDAQVQAIDAFIADALYTLLETRDAPMAVASIRFAASSFPVAVVLGRLARYHQHLTGVACSLLETVEPDAVVETASGWADGIQWWEHGRLEDTVVALEDVFRNGREPHWPEDDEAELRLIVGGFLVVSAAVAVLADQRREPPVELLDDLYG